jgi:enoyl-CoA hydratase/carnithine racemase
MSYEHIIAHREETWLEVTINRPERMNAIAEQTADEILSALADAEGDSAVACVILQGTEKAFCTGMDTTEMKLEPGGYFDFYRFRKRRRKANYLFRDLPQYTKPVISAIEGFALGGGLELALVTDMIVAGAGAQFGLPEAKLGAMPGGGGTQTLARLIGRPLAKELMWTGRRFTAEEAKELRLVNHVVPRGEALKKAREIAAAIGKNAPLSIMLSKAAIDRGADMSLADGMATEGDISFLLYLSQDRDEGLAAFREKRQPQFKGR